MIKDHQGIKFSVLVPVYNVETYVEECIKSVLNQTYANFELILVDDGSTDTSGEICDKYSCYDRVKVYHKPNEGLIHTRRYAIERASGDFYVFLDSDDYLALNALEIIYDTVCRTNGDCIIYGMNRVFEGKCFATIIEPQEAIITDKLELYRKCFLSAAYNPLCLKAVKSTVFSNVDYSSHYGIKRGEDLLQSVEIYKNSERVVFIPAALYNYTLNPNSITQRINYDKYSFDYLAVRDRVLQFLKEEGLFSNQDFNRFRTYVIKITIDEIINLCAADLSIGHKIELLNRIRACNIYSSFLRVDDYDKKSIGKKNLVFSLFKRKLDLPLIAVISCVIRIKKVARKS